jgi:hypothetical protein
MPELDPWLADHVSGDLTQMALDLSATDPRVQKGCVLASQSQRWICGRSRHGEQVCSCRDFRYRDPDPCKHIVAVHVAELSRTYL